MRDQYEWNVVVRKRLDGTKREKQGQQRQDFASLDVGISKDV